MTFNTLAEARGAALTLSKSHPKMYFVITADFGWTVVSLAKLGLQTPSTATDWTGRTGTYWLNGIEKKFSKAQIIADQNSTPVSM
jgi:hypothetical protein